MDASCKYMRLKDIPNEWNSKLLFFSDLVLGRNIMWWCSVAFVCFCRGNVAAGLVHLLLLLDIGCWRQKIHSVLLATLARAPTTVE